MLEKPRVGVSACLLGQKVRYDGGHKEHLWLINILAPHVEWIPVCPEMELGLPAPRSTLRLIRGEEGEVRLYMPESQEDHSEAMRAYAAARVEVLASEGLCVYILKSNSPSCGLKGLKIYERDGGISHDGQGLFAEALRQRLPELLLNEERDLDDLKNRGKLLRQILGET